MTARIGVTGLGRIGELHAHNLAGSGLVSSLVLHDADGEKARALAAHLGTDVAGSFQELLRCGLDGLVVATPTPSHADLVTDALRRDVATFCEKPLALSLGASRAVAALAVERAAPLQVGLQRRCDPELLELRARLHRGDDGRLIGLRLVSSSWRPPPREYVPGSGGFFRDKLLHDVDVVRWLTGGAIVAAAVVGTGAATGWMSEEGDVDTVSASLILAGGVVAQIWAARLSPTRFEFRLDAVCERRELSAGRWDEGDPAQPTRAESPFGTFIDRFAEAYSAEMVSFCRLVAGTGANVCTGPDAVESEIAAAALERAWREGRVVRLAEMAWELGESDE
ncbi:MAG TPA: Gfo/Idh/MocA family oxidoreductase [Acidimicrobiales bacterium]|nr:Gfo/Idh/MocA family oxidoreductase [Acidimicrobiales bacterium]